MKCFQKLLDISYRDHITNEEVKTRIKNNIGPYEELLTSAKRLKLKWYGPLHKHLDRPALSYKAQCKERDAGVDKEREWEDNTTSHQGTQEYQNSSDRQSLTITESLLQVKAINTPESSL